MALDGADYYYPTHDQAVQALLNAILTHREVRNSKIYYPVVIGEAPRLDPIRIVSARDFGGMELIEDGLTLAVYPMHGSFRQKSANFSQSKDSKSVVYTDKYLGRAGGEMYGVYSTFSFVVQIFYRDAGIGVPVEIKSDVVGEGNDEYYPLSIPPGELVQFKDNDLPTDTKTLEEFIGNDNATISESSLGTDVSLTILTQPGERILRSWMSLLVKVIRSMTVLRPFSIKNPTVEYVDYPTSNWLRDSPNIAFHTAYAVVSYDCIEPVGAAEFLFPAPKEVNIQVETL